VVERLVYTLMLPGGQTDKLGNRYESWWTVHQLVRMILGEALSIRIEHPGVEKAEFVLQTTQGEELHQAKRAHHDGKWSLSELGNSQNKLLQAIHRQLVGNQRKFVFVSGSDAPELRELADRARDAASFEEFRSLHIKADVQRNAFDKLLRIWNEKDEVRAHDVLKRIQIRTSDEHVLIQLVSSQLRAAFFASVAEIVAELRAITADRVSETLSRDRLLRNLEVKGIKLRTITPGQSALPAIETITTNYLTGLKRHLIGQKLVPRKAAPELLVRTTSNPLGSDTVLTGKAGTGKSGCILQFVELLQEKGIPVLAIRLDRLEPVATGYEVGRQLGLEESPVHVLASIAGGKPVVLVIDQLDAVSTSSGRNADFLDAVECLVDEVRGLRCRYQIHLVLVCRQFDWENDHRLRKLISETDPKISLGDFDKLEVESILKTAGFSSKRLTTKQWELLQTPQNLALFVQCPAAWDKLGGFGSTKDLFDAYWTNKREAVNQRAAPEPDTWSQITDLLAGRMTETQQLSVPREFLDSVSPTYLNQMVSEGVLAFDGLRYGFGHESFFDYCFARRFVRAGATLTATLTASEQHLFRRAQVRQVLAYLRDADMERYCQEFDSLLSSGAVRTHIKDLALSLLANVVEVHPDEWSMLEPWIQEHMGKIADSGRNAEKLSLLVWQHFFVSQSWFLATNARKLTEDWLKTPNDRTNNVAVQYLRFHQRQNGDEVASLLEPYADMGGEWPQRLRFCMEWVDHENSRRFFDLFLRLIDNGVLDEARDRLAMNGTFWSMLYGLCTNRPEWTPEVLSHWLRRRLTLLQDRKDDNGRIPWSELFGHDDFGSNHVGAAARLQPAIFVREFLPVALDLSEASANEAGDPPRYDLVWHHIYPTEHLSIEQVCQVALRKALGSLAAENSPEIGAIVEDLLARTTHFSNALLFGIFTDGAKHYANKAVSCVCTQPWRFHCGYSDSSYWIAREMVTAIAPFCTAHDLIALESAILNYVPNWERSESGHRWIGSASHTLLTGLPQNLRSSAGNRRFAELARKFGASAEQPRGFVGGFVGSPIAKEATERMTDDQWLRAIAKYDTEERKDRFRDILKGGAWQLARSLEDYAKTDPERFARLAMRFPLTTNPCYLDRVLAGLRTSVCPTYLKLDVCRKAFTENRIACGKAIVDLLGGIEERLDDEFVKMLHWIAVNHPDPEKELWMVDAGGGVPYYRGDILTTGINTDRGRAAEAIASLIWHHCDYLERFSPTLKMMVQDRSLSVRACVAKALLAAANHDEEFALQLFISLSDHNPQFLSTAYAEQFIYQGIKDYFPRLKPQVEALLRSELPDAAEAGGRLASLAALWGHSVDNLIEEALDGTAARRLGIAKVVATNFTHDECRSWCEPLLRRFFNDDDHDVRRSAAHCFSQLQDGPITAYEGLIQAFCDSKAYQEDSFWILHVLDESKHRLPAVTWNVCQKFLTRFSGEARDISTGRSGDSRTMSKLVFRVYQQYQRTDWGVKCLDLIDTMILEGLHDAQTGMSEFER
jgi:hypothetical protein